MFSCSARSLGILHPTLESIGIKNMCGCLINANVSSCSSLREQAGKKDTWAAIQSSYLSGESWGFICIGRELKERQGRGPREGNTGGLLSLDEACMRPESEDKG